VEVVKRSRYFLFSTQDHKAKDNRIFH
jgi:hypothetical protein